MPLLDARLGWSGARLIARGLFILQLGGWPAIGIAAGRPAECVPGEGKSPPWLASLDIQGRNALTSAQWYRDWLAVTADLCTDVRHADRDNPGVKIVWRGSGDADKKLLFYGAGNHHYEPAAVFDEGLQVIKADGSLKIRPGTGQSTASALKSSSFSYALAERFALVSHDERHYVYAINAPGGIAVDESLGSEGTGNEEEIAFPGGVKSRFVKGMFENRLVYGEPGRTPYVETLAYTPNPRYWQGAKGAGDGEVDVMVSSREAVDVLGGGRAVDASTWRFPATDGRGAATQAQLSTHDGSAALWATTGHRQPRFPPEAGYRCALVDTALERNHALAVTRTPILEVATPRRSAGTCVYLSDRDVAVRDAGAEATRGADHYWTRLSVHWNRPADLARVRGYRIYWTDIYGNPVQIVGDILDPNATRYAVSEDMGRKLGLRDHVDGLIPVYLDIYTVMEGAPEAESFSPVQVKVNVAPARFNAIRRIAGASSPAAGSRGQ
ncbi:hypothetical protein LQD23_18850 [Chromobacterium violaceum]|uniref:scabin-related ADP-ribosyltransferase n=1 Tax=Chromobacterium violaceum TaxID=536 RepID=UPI001E4227F4|nr:hypothetical protein [Chromobacterium violaceum]MCD0494337.1 hypothetical protein [Chromobacterium violaceum]